MTQAVTLTQQQLQRALDYTRRQRHGRRNRAILLLTHWAGMRVGEVAALRYSDVISSTGDIVTEIRLAAAQTKGSRSRTVIVSERMRAELAIYCAHYRPKNSTDPLFYTQRRAGFTADTLTHIVNGLYQQAGLEGASSHSGRRTFITTLAEKGVSARVLMSLAGHQNLSTTQRYIDIKPSMLRAAVELV
jgi:integrase/recombinase XerD